MVIFEYFPMKICISIVVTEKFATGALVMLDSFVTKNYWFDGDIAIIHDDLNDQTKEIFLACFSRFSINWVQVSVNLAGMLNNLIKEYPQHIIERFYSIESFSLYDYDKVLFFDSDLLFCDSIENLLSYPDPIICCPDGRHYLEKRPDSNPAGFNAGMMIVNNSLLNRYTYETLLSWLELSNWQKLEPTVYNDQAIFSEQFSKIKRLISSEYNYVLSFDKEISLRTELSINNACVLHFNGPIKPWISKQVLAGVQNNPSLIRAFELWFKAYMKTVTKVGLCSQLLPYNK